MLEAVRDRLNRRAILLGGLFGGLAYLIVAVTLSPLAGSMPFEALRLKGALALGAQALSDGLLLRPKVALSALVVHLTLSCLFTAGLGALVTGRSRLLGITAGLLFGGALHLINFHGLALLFPWLSAGQNVAIFLAHVAWGGTAAWMYLAASQPQQRAQSREPLAAM